MILPSSRALRAVRNAQSGITLLEVLVAFAIVAVVMVSVFESLPWLAMQQAKRLHDLWLSEYARSVLEEYSVTGPSVATSGQSPGGWHWQISETDVRPNPLGPMDTDMGYVSATARVWNESEPNSVTEANTLLARRLR